MKIRSDFVTNSSSSSFTVSLIIETKDGKKIWLDYGNDDLEYNSDVSVYGNAGEMLEAATVGELMERLSIIGPARIHTDEDDEFGEYDVDEFDGEDDEEYGNDDADEYGNDDYDEDEDEEDEDEDNLPEELKQNRDSALETVTIKRYWFATGEWSSSFAYHVDDYLPDLKELCRKVLDTEGEEKEQAKSELQAYLDNAEDLEISHGNGTWPDNLCDADGINRIEWQQFAGSVEELARKVMNDMLPSDSDRGEEILKLDFAEKTAEATNIYYLE